MTALDPQTGPQLAEDDQRARQLIDRYVVAFEAYDIGEIVDLLTEDTAWEMPPFTGWYRGAGDIGRLIAEQCPATGAGDMRIVRTSANGQPLLAVYMRDTGGTHRAFQLQQLTLSATGVAHVACYFDTGLFRTFGLPDVLPTPGT